MDAAFFTKLIVNGAGCDFLLRSVRSKQVRAANNTEQIIRLHFDVGMLDKKIHTFLPGTPTSQFRLNRDWSDLWSNHGKRFFEKAHEAVRSSYL